MGNPLKMTDKTIEALDCIRKYGYIYHEKSVKGNWNVPGNDEIKISDKSIFALYRRGIITIYAIDQFTVGARFTREGSA